METKTIHATLTKEQASRMSFDHNEIDDYSDCNGSDYVDLGCIIYDLNEEMREWIDSLCGKDTSNTIISIGYSEPEGLNVYVYECGYATDVIKLSGTGAEELKNWIIKNSPNAYEILNKKATEEIAELLKGVKGFSIFKDGSMTIIKYENENAVFTIETETEEIK